MNQVEENIIACQRLGQELSVADARLGAAKVKPIAPATFHDFQDWPGRAPIQLWKLTSAIPGHSNTSILSSETLLEEGYQLPEIPFRPKAVISDM